VEEATSPADRSRQLPVAPVEVGSTDLDLEFWVEWGGGEPRSWLGTLELDQGSIETARGYGLQADAPGSIYLKNNVVTISPRLPRSYDSVLLRVRAPRNANLSVSFLANGTTSGAFESKFRLMDLVTSTQHRALDDRANKLIIRRTQSDSLRLQSNRKSMVFVPGELFNFSVLPNLVDFDQLQHQVRVQLRPARSTSNLWVDEREVENSSVGSISPAGPFRLTMPSDEGVYDLIISIDKRRSFPASQAQIGLWRKLQLVVVQSERDGRAIPGTQRTAGQQFQVIQEFDPADPEQPLLVRKFLSSFGSQETARRPTLYGDVVSVKQLDRDMLKIGVDSWFALPLQITQPGRPHIVEIDYPNDAQQTLGLAIYEPGSRRAVVDVGLMTSAGSLAEKPGVTTYRLTFWPKSTAPILVIADRDANRDATIGAIRVLAGPHSLPNLETRSPAEGRLLAAHLTTPLFSELFSATSDIDQKSGRKLRDWVTFFDGAKRLIQVLRSRGDNGAVIPVLADGGSLYPSSLLEPTPLFDDGVFFSTAQDPMQKDVLEMLLRMFDREGLRLVPSIKFTGTLPILESKRRLGTSPSINLVNTAGKRWRPQPISFGVGTHYNPLDLKVQAAMRAVVSELSQRCASHASFAGVAIQLDPDSYATLPGPDWGSDDATLTRFMAAQTGTTLNRASEQRVQQEWLAWRADRLSDMYHQMSDTLRKNVPGAQLYLLGSSLLDTPLVRNAAAVSRAPDGLTVSSALLSFGINVERIREAGVVFLSPRQIRPVLSDQVDIDRAWDADYVRLCGPQSGSNTGSLLQYPFQVFDATTVAGKLPIEGIALMTKTKIGATGPIGRRGIAQGLAALDSQVIFDGSWQTPHDEQSCQDSMTVFRNLPEMKFETVSPPVGSRSQPVVVRRGRRGGRVYFYVVNDSPRPVVTKIGFAGRTTLRLKSLSTKVLPRLVMTEKGLTLPLMLRPYEIVGIEASEPDARIVRWETKVDQLVVKTQHESLQRLKQCVDARRDYLQLKNMDFEQPVTQNDIPGWEFSEGAGMHVAVDTQASHKGRQSLHLRSETPVNWSNGPIVWLRSEWFVPAASGRLVFGGWLKTVNVDNQPHVRLVIEGRLPNNQLVRHERVLGAVQNDSLARPLGADWNYYTVFAEGLPANVKEIRVGIDLRGTGDVWVDHVGLYDIWLNEQERKGLNRDIAISTSMLEQGRVSDSERLLKSHYAQFLFANYSADSTTHVQVPARTTGDRETPARSTVGNAGPARSAPARSTVGNAGPVWPKIPDAAPARSTLGDSGPARSTIGDGRPARSTIERGGPATATIGDIAKEPPRELPRQPVSTQVTAWPDFGPLPKNDSRHVDPPRQTSEPRQLTSSPPTEIDRNQTDSRERPARPTPITDRAYPATDRPYPDTNRRSNISATPPPAEPKPASWLDKLKDFKFKLPEWQTRPTR
jgi:hypothetical protein